MAQPDNSVVANPINNPPQAQQDTPGYGNVVQDLGNAAMQYGGNLLASGAAEYFQSPALGETIAGLTEATTSIMHDRFWKSEFENFQQTYGQQYQTAAQQIWAGYNEFENQLGNKFDDNSIQMRNQGMQDLMSKVQQLDVQFMQNAAKFGNNPLIGNMANSLMQQRAQWMSGMLGSYTQVLGDAEAHANLQKAQFQVSPEMQQATLEGKQADTKLKQAQAGEAGARSGLLNAQAQDVKQGEGADLPNVPAGRLNTWLITDPKGKAVLTPYLQQAEARLRDRLASRDPALQNNPEALDNKVRMAAPQIRKEAVAAAMQDILPADAYASILKDNPRVSTQLLSEETPTDSPSIAKRYSQSELRGLVQGEKDRTGLGEGLIIPAAEALARSEDIKSFDDLKSKIKEAVDEEVNTMVADFKGNEEVKQNLSKEMMSYFNENWARSNFLADEYGGGTGLLGRAKRAVMDINETGGPFRVEKELYGKAKRAITGK
jgi:hypothetical protein